MSKISESNQTIRDLIPWPNLTDFSPSWLLVSAYGADGTWVGKTSGGKECFILPRPSE